MSAGRPGREMDHELGELPPAKKAERIERANGSALQAQRLTRSCPNCENKNAWPVIRAVGNRRVVKCDNCGHEWTTNVKRGEL